MPYTVDLYNDRAREIRVVNIFPRGQWRLLGLSRLLCRYCVTTYWAFPVILAGSQPVLLGTGAVAFSMINLIARFHKPLHTKILALKAEARRKRSQSVGWVFLLINSFAPGASWRIHHACASRARFEQDYRQAWINRLEAEGKVYEIEVFIGKDSTRVPLLFDIEDDAVGSDRETMEVLRMWYCWSQVKRGFSEILLPRTLTRIDKVELSNVGSGISVLGKRIGTLELGRGGISNVVNFEEPQRLPEKQRDLTEALLESRTTVGLEFVRAWDTAAVSIISLMPFAMSLVFAAVWMGVSTGKYGVDAQVATQTAFTVAAYIVTAGALLIALFAFLDTQSQKD